MAIMHLSDGSFEAFIANGVSVVDFWASWCGPCRMFGPIFETAADKITSVKFGKYELTDSNREAAVKYGVRSIPSILAFKAGALVDTKVGLMDEGEFLKWIGGLS